jgi:hypothetical protein
MSMSTMMQGKPWYRERWPWLLMLPPATAIVAGVITAWIAVVSSDGVVEDDYYKQGLAVNQRLARDEAARRRGIGADLMLSADGRTIRAVLRAATPLGAELRLRLTHPTRPGYDQETLLVRGDGEVYEARLLQPINGRRIASIEPLAGDWRLVGEWDAAREDGLALGSAPRPAGGSVPGR